MSCDSQNINSFRHGRHLLRRIVADAPPVPVVPVFRTPMKKLLTFVTVLGLAVIITGCTYTRSTTTIQTPAVYQVSTNSAGVVSTNLVAPATTQTVTKKDRIFLPEGYILSQESDVYGIDVAANSSSTGTPEVKAGISHLSQRWVPTSTNDLHAPTVALAGSVNNKAIPFWMSANATFNTGAAQSSQGSDTNGPTTVSGAIAPGTPLNQTK